MKKLMSLLLVFIMIVGLCACSGENGNDEIPTLSWLLPAESQADLQSVQDALNEIIEEKVGARVELQFISPGAYSEKMRMKMASNEAFDICFAGWVNKYATSVSNGGLMDITDYIDKVDGLREAIPDYVWDAATVDGRIYGVPNIQTHILPYTLMINKNIASKYDFDFSTIKHINDLEPYLEELKKNESGIYPFSPSYGVLPWYADKYESVGFEHIILPRGSSNPEDLTFTFETKEWNDGVNKLWDWYQKGYIRKDVLSSGADTTDRKAGKYAVEIGGWKYGADIAWEASYGIPVITQLIDEPYVTRNRCLTTMYCVGPNCKYPEKALEVIKLLHTDERMINLLTFGIEGKHYNMVDNRVQAISDSGYNQNGDSWKFGCQWNAKLMPGQEDTIWEDTKALNESAEKSALMQFEFDKTPVKTELSNLANIDAEYEVFNKGAADPKTYMDEFIRKLKDAGIDKVYEEVKRQLAEYNASK